MNVIFHVADVYQEEGSPYSVIEAHSNIVGSASPVFKAMIFGPLNTGPGVPIFIEDTTVHAFSTMLNFLYRRKLPKCLPYQLLEVYNLAHKYSLPLLEKMCEDLLRDCTDMFPLFETCRAIGRHHHLEPVVDILRRKFRRELSLSLTHQRISLTKDSLNSIQTAEEFDSIRFVFNTI